MEDENETKGAENEAREVAEEKAPQQPPESTGAGDSGNGIKSFAARHKMLAGAGIAVLAVLLVAGIFFAGFAAGRLCGEPGREPGGARIQPGMPGLPDQRSQPSPQGDRDGFGRRDIWIEHQDEITEAIATGLGISAEELREELADGMTVAEMAEEKGVAMEDLTAAVAAKVSEIADELVDDGEITARQAERIKSNAEDIAAMLVRRAGRPAAAPGR